MNDTLNSRDHRMETVGVYLKKERESQNISLGEVSRLTKISEIYLHCIEKDEFDKLPQGPYAKGYIASYSRIIGGDVDKAIQLYESLNKIKTQTEELQPGITKNDLTDTLLEPPEADEPEISIPSGAATTISAFNTVASYVKGKSASLKAAILSLTSIGTKLKKVPAPRAAFVLKPKDKPSPTDADPSVQTIRPSKPDKRMYLSKMGLAFKNAASAVSPPAWLTDRRIWLYAGVILFGAGILVLAVFGFYHLFIYDPNPLTVAELQQLKDAKSDRPAAMGSEKAVLPSDPTDASLPADQLERPANNKEPTTRARSPESQQRSADLSTGSRAAITSTKLKPEKPPDTSGPANRASSPLSGSSATADNAASGRTAAGKESRALSAQREMAAGPSPASETTDASPTVLQASVCSEIKNRMPSGVQTVFPWATQRVYVWSAIEVQQVPSEIRHIYYFKDRVISDVSLDVRSPYWRTWSYKIIAKERYRGEWRVDITSADGEVLRRLYFEIK
jgi:cytoskeletal protein RodZ